MEDSFCASMSSLSWKKRIESPNPALTVSHVYTLYLQICLSNLFCLNMSNKTLCILWSTSIWVFPKIGVPQNAWFIMETPINPWMIWGENPLFSETSIYTSMKRMWPKPHLRFPILRPLPLPSRRLVPRMSCDWKLPAKAAKKREGVAAPGFPVINSYIKPTPTVDGRNLAPDV